MRKRHLLLGSPWWVLALALWTLLPGCGKDKPLEHFTNRPPEISSLGAAPNQMKTGEQSTITVAATDPDADSLYYSWRVSAGTIVTSHRDRPTMRWQAPSAAGTYTVRAVVWDDAENADSAEVAITVAARIAALNGTVRDSETQAAVDSAVVIVGAARDTTNAEGRYRLENLAVGTATLTVTRRGYEPHNAILPELQEGENNLIAIQLERIVPRSQVTGTITNSLAEPVVGATVRLGAAQTTTAVDGFFRFDNVRQGTYTLRITAAGYASFEESVTLDSETETFHRELDATLLPGVQDVVAAKIEPTGLRVTWSSLTGLSVRGYRIYASANGATYAVAGDVPPTSTSFAMEGQANKRYRFFVAALNFENEEGNPSNLSNVVLLTFPSALVTVPQGGFIMGDTPDGYGTSDHPGLPVQVPAFRIEPTEVSNLQYMAYLWEAWSKGEIVVDAQSARSGPTTLIYFGESKLDADPGNDVLSISTGFEDHPVAGVTWYGARAYAEAYGRRLPTEAEWEKAARGTSRDTGQHTSGIGFGYQYPWGQTAPDAAHANFMPLGPSRTLPVTSLPAGAAPHWSSPLFHMAGNVWEWCNDWLGPYRNPQLPPSTGTAKILRGGSYATDAGTLRTGARFSFDPATGTRTVGFRCAANP